MDSNPNRKENEIWKYISGSDVVHFLGNDFSIFPGRSMAECGRERSPSHWRGTGSQREYDHAAKCRECSLCLKALGRL